MKFSSTCPVFKYFQGLEFRRKKFKYFQECVGSLYFTNLGLNFLQKVFFSDVLITVSSDTYEKLLKSTQVKKVKTVQSKKVTKS